MTFEIKQHKFLITTQKSPTTYTYTFTPTNNIQFQFYPFLIIFTPTEYTKFYPFQWFVGVKV